VVDETDSPSPDCSGNPFLLFCHSDEGGISTKKIATESGKQLLILPIVRMTKEDKNSSNKTQNRCQ
jgi:hypothetical protein